MLRMSIPNDWLCPITLSIMRDPVIVADGHTYERNAIQKWFTEQRARGDHVRSPKTNELLVNLGLIPNIALRNTIEDFLAKNPQPTVSSVVPSYTQSALTLSSRVYEARGAKHLHMKVSATDASKRQPIVLIAIVDNSGSMGEVADTEATESFGYTRMDLVKHTMRTLAAVLQEDDMLAIVSYSTSARVVVTPTRMNAAGKSWVSAALNTINPDSQTNIYDGIRQAAALANAPELAGRNIVALLLTDGFPNVNPPRGILPTLAAMEMKNHWTLHTFGFGYKLDSVLLSALAEWGGGLFGFIPDCSMVATIFINLIANVLSTATTNATLTYDGTVIQTGPIMYGQSRDFVVPLTGDSLPVCTLNGALTVSEETDIEFADSRYQFMSAIKTCLSKAAGSKNDEAVALLKTVASSLKVPEFVKDICGQDPEGQVGMAPDQKYYTKWGEHYMRSYLRAQYLQQCMNFKDPGLQIYGGDLFHEIQKIGDKAFDDLPPPIPSGQPVRPNLAYNNMPTPLRSLTATLNNPSGGCFGGNCQVLMADFTRMSIKDIAPGSIVWTPTGPAKVVALVTCHTKNKSQPMSQINGLSITPWHPIRIKGVWEFPASLYFYTERMIQTVYNLVLDKGHIVSVEGIDCITLGHDFTEPIAAHEFFGTQRVIDDLKKMPGWAEGRPTINNLVAVKDPETNMIIEWRDV